MLVHVLFIFTYYPHFQGVCCYFHYILIFSLHSFKFYAIIADSKIELYFNTYLRIEQMVNRKSKRYQKYYREGYNNHKNYINTIHRHNVRPDSPMIGLLEGINDRLQDAARGCVQFKT